MIATYTGRRIHNMPDAGPSFSLMEKHRTANLEHAYFD